MLRRRRSLGPIEREGGREQRNTMGRDSGQSAPAQRSFENFCQVWKSQQQHYFCSMSCKYRDGLKYAFQVPWIWGEEIAFSCLHQAGERNFFTSYSQNLGSILLPIPVGWDIMVGFDNPPWGLRYIPPSQFPMQAPSIGPRTCTKPLKDVSKRVRLKPEWNNKRLSSPVTFGRRFPNWVPRIQWHMMQDFAL